MDILIKLPVLIVLGFTRVVRSLTLRIVLSLMLFGLLFLGYFTGLIEPHGM